MTESIEYSPRERRSLWIVAAVGFFGLNGVFLYALVFQRDALARALANPVAAVLIAEALTLVALSAHLLRRWRVARLSWGWFVLLPLVGSIAFALPVVLLWPAKSSRGSGIDGAA